MDFSLTEDQLAIRARSRRSAPTSATSTGCEKDREGGFPHDFHAALASAGWLGIAMPTESAARGSASPRRRS